MSYSEEEIKKYINIIDEYKRGVQGENPPRHSHKLEPYMGQWVCIECGVLKGHILGQYDINDFDRLHYQKRVFIIANIILRKRLIIFLN